MQLSPTLFAIAVIQIKPQLERVLNLPPDALTKEIRLTQQLTTLFVEHQIPADVLAYDDMTDGSGGAADDDATAARASTTASRIAGYSPTLPIDEM